MKFIGSADKRIKEDFLRILRFFRFYSMFGVGEPDKKALKACAENNENLKNLPMERIKDELFKLLLTPQAVKTLKIMQENNVLSYVLPDMGYFDNLDYLKKLFNGKFLASKPLLYLFTIYQPNEILAENMAIRLKLSKKEKQQFLKWATIDINLKDLSDKTFVKHVAYEHGKDFCLEKLLLTAAKLKESLPDFWNIYSQIENLDIPEFPVKGKDILNEGISHEQIGKRLKLLEKRWKESNFSLTKEELLRPELNKVSGE